MDDITTQQLAEVLSIVTGGEFTPDELLSNAHAMKVLAPDDSRRERLYLAVLGAHEAQRTVTAGRSLGTSWSLRWSC